MEASENAAVACSNDVLSVFRFRDGILFSKKSLVQYQYVYHVVARLCRDWRLTHRIDD